MLVKAGTRAPAGRVLGTGRVLGMVALAGALGGCVGSGGEGGGSTLSNLLLYGGTTVPPVAPASRIEVAECPPVGVADGGSSVKSGGGQVSISNVARECAGREDGAVIVKVGVEIRGLLGPGGSSGRFEAPVSIALKRGDQVVASRTRRVAVSVPPGETSQTAAVVEEGLVVPPGTGEFDIEVSLAGAGRPVAPTTRRRARG